MELNHRLSRNFEAPEKAKLILLFCGCAMLAFLPIALAEESPEETAWSEAVTGIISEGEKTETFEGVTIPLLLAPKLEKQWGKPTIRVAADGSYQAFYKDPDKPFEIVQIFGFGKPIPTLVTAPDEWHDTIVNGELGTVRKPQQWRTETVRIKTPSGRQKTEIPYFRRSSGGGADGPLDSTNTFTVTVAGVTGHYVVWIESVSSSVAKRLKALEVE
ncbi:MAG: hypothetical protein AAF236_07375 [Verrucomicrobiota bacterium]